QREPNYSPNQLNGRLQWHNAELLLQQPLATGGQDQLTTAQSSHQPPLVQKMGKQPGSQLASQMHAPLAPVETVARKVALATRLTIDPKLREMVLPLRSQGITAGIQPTSGNQAVMESHPQLARQMVKTGAGKAQSFRSLATK